MTIEYDDTTKQAILGAINGQVATALAVLSENKPLTAMDVIKARHEWLRDFLQEKKENLVELCDRGFQPPPLDYGTFRVHISAPVRHEIKVHPYPEPRDEFWSSHLGVGDEDEDEDDLQEAQEVARRDRPYRVCLERGERVAVVSGPAKGVCGVIEKVLPGSAQPMFQLALDRPVNGKSTLVVLRSGIKESP